MNVDRRRFLRRAIASALGGVSLYSAFGQLRLAAAAANAAKGGVFSDYKALVCVFLDGGNDAFNTLVPWDAAHYDIYQAGRPSVALAQALVEANALQPEAGHPPSDGASYGLHPSMPELRELFNQQRAAVVANVGPLLGPITKAQYLANPKLAPPQLFSHGDQVNSWQTSRPNDRNANGWGGRIADLLHAGNPNPNLPMTMSLPGYSLFHRATAVDQYVLKPCAPEGGCALAGIDYTAQGSLDEAAFAAMMAQGTQAHPFERAYARASRHAVEFHETLSAALQPAPEWITPFPDTTLGRQLRQVANVVAARDALAMRRQTFFVNLRGFDTHDGQVGAHAALLADLSQSLDAFYRATVQLGIETGVTTFTASDFGRTVDTNYDGTEHGWGGHHFVVGGAVRGGRFFGTLPSLQQPATNDAFVFGRLIPTLGVDQYAATLATWFGVPAGELGTILPGLLQYDYASSDLGFMA